MSTITFSLEVASDQLAAVVAAITNAVSPKTAAVPTQPKATIPAVPAPMPVQPKAVPVNPTMHTQMPQQGVTTPTNGTAVAGFATAQPAPTVYPVIPTANPAPVVAPTAPTREYTLDDLAVAAQGLMDAGKIQELTNLLGQFNIQSMQQLPKESYGMFATALRGMGAKI